MSWYPGAFAHDYGGTGSCYPDSVVLHEVVNDITIPADGSPSNIAGWVQSSLAVQFYVDYAGSAEQFCDSYRASSHCKDGNGHRLGIETQDDRPQTAEQSNAGSWKAPQRERLADIAAWIAATHGMPIRNMATSRRADTGVGYHRLGVPQIAGGLDGWSDGECWTTSPGKPCPGDGRIAQVPGIVARAAIILAAVRAGRCGFLPPGPVDLSAALARTGTTPPEDELSAAEVNQILSAIKCLPTDMWIKPITSDTPGGHANELLAAIKAGVAQAVTQAAAQAASELQVLQHPQGTSLGIVIDDSTGAWYEVGPGVFWHLPTMDYVNTGRASKLLDSDEHHTNAAGIVRIREMASAGIGPIWVKPAPKAQ